MNCKVDSKPFQNTLAPFCCPLDRHSYLQPDSRPKFLSGFSPNSKGRVVCKLTDMVGRFEPPRLPRTSYCTAVVPTSGILGSLDVCLELHWMWDVGRVQKILTMGTVRLGPRARMDGPKVWAKKDLHCFSGKLGGPKSTGSACIRTPLGIYTLWKGTHTLHSQTEVSINQGP